MIQPDRLTAPATHPIDTVNPQFPEQFSLSNGMEVYSLSAGSQEVLKVELLFAAGTSRYSNSLIPSFTASMLQEGTHQRNAAQIANDVDDYGAFLELDIDKDFSGITLYSLNKHLAKTLPVVEDILMNSTFPEEEWEIMRSNRIQKYTVNLGKVGFVAGKRFQELLYAETPYGTSFDVNDYRAMQRNELIHFYQNQYAPTAAKLFVSGKMDDSIHQLLESTFGQLKGDGKFLPALALATPVTFSERKQFIPKEDAIQSAIRIGRRMFPKSNPDYFAMKVLTTILGGYFGSRLMTNIREDKGYTYGIGAGVMPYRSDSYFYISTEVGSDVCSAALDEIYKEIRTLRDELVSNEELDLVKNYLLGSLLKSFEGPFERMERFKNLHLYGVGNDYYQQYTAAIRAVSPHKLQELAKTWLQEDDLLELVVGKK
ncbi:MAG TPA: pitrilysin family protein [Flavobacteriales bacterium]|nr:pitrilysin family protein [Flavobacteriales bacterium]HPH81442.1 pitrilysin family protein [Flavobacteriales bacterium]